MADAPGAVTGHMARSADAYAAPESNRAALGLSTWMVAVVAAAKDRSDSRDDQPGGRVDAA